MLWWRTTRKRKKNTSDDSYIYQLSLVLATATISYNEVSVFTIAPSYSLSLTFSITIACDTCTHRYLPTWYWAVSTLYDVGYSCIILLSSTALVLSRKLKRQLRRESSVALKIRDWPANQKVLRLDFGVNPPTSTTQIAGFTGGRSYYREHHSITTLTTAAEEVMRSYTSSSGPPAVREKNYRAAWSRGGIDRVAGASAMPVRGYCPLQYLCTQLRAG